MFKRKKIARLEAEIEVQKGMITDLQQMVTEICTAIDKKVDKNDVINQVNQSTEEIKISGKKIHITRETLINNNSIRSDAITSLEGRKVVANTLSEISNHLGDIN